ncbi:mediator of RNA polymerase II transcription subunit 15a-like protein [Perilla frutescens var. hirtella]|nr:mediator of RNA polymerase II transcription subunit 15a-like protein [Perilla frutescens var. hirtella]
MDGAEVAADMEVSDWRNQLQSESRTRIVNKINCEIMMIRVKTLKRHLPFSGLDGALEVERIAVRFEEKIYTAATIQSDYLRKISLKMLTLETRSQNPTVNSLQSNAASYSENSEDPGTNTHVADFGVSAQLTRTISRRKVYS